MRPTHCAAAARPSSCSTPSRARSSRRCSGIRATTLWAKGGDHLIVPYAFDTNDTKFASLSGFEFGRDCLDYLCDSFDQFWEEGAQTPRLMSVGLHCRLAGRPGRLRALTRFLDHVAAHDDVWITRRSAIARHWLHKHPMRNG